MEDPAVGSLIERKIRKALGASFPTPSWKLRSDRQAKFCNVEKPDFGYRARNRFKKPERKRFEGDPDIGLWNSDSRIRISVRPDYGGLGEQL